MTKDAVDAALDYINVEGCPAQITYDGGNGEWYIDFRSRFHAEVCKAELKDRGFYNTELLSTAYHMRLQ